MRNHPILLSALCLAIGLSIGPVLAAPNDVPPATGAPGARLFSVADTNQDGFVDRTEWRAARDRIFERLDANKDGRLNRDEMDRGRTARPGSPRPNSDAQFERGQQRRQAAFDRMDKDHDGFISPIEFAANSDAIFQRCDKNGDGKIAKGECRRTGQRAAAMPR